MNSSIQRMFAAGLGSALNICFIVAIAGGLLVACPAIAADGIKGRLVTVEWLDKNLKRTDLVLLDASSSQLYAAKHIPGALNTDYFAYGFPERTSEQMEQHYQSWGISPSKTIVLYDMGASYYATRLMYALEYHGFPTRNLYVLDGGIAKWQAQGLPVTKEASPAPSKGDFKIKTIKEDLRTRTPELVAASGDPVNHVLLEALGADWHFGEMLAFDRAGHIPNAKMLPAADYFNADKTFKSPEEIQKMLNYLGIKPEQQIHTHCGGGIAASTPYFALKHILNYPKVKLSTESQMGWLSDGRELPYWTYDAPLMMRGTNWVQSWGGKMLRMYGASTVSIVDVRPPESFKEGHVPFSLNIPGDVFKAHAADPVKLAQVLGPAGVDASHETVIVSGAGLTKDAALAYVLLEKLGQKKVSVFMDTVETWRERGFTVATDATVVGPRKSIYDMAIPPTVYPVNLRKEIAIADPKSTQGIYPKVFIASGKALPAQTALSPVQDGKVVHVPYTDLLKPDGTPKAAKDIWTILTKAGVPRYAELVAFSDDPGEAAANYFILKLMGFPDIKVLMI